MIDMFLVRREILINSLPKECRKNCTLAKYVITDVCRTPEDNTRGLNIDAAKILLSECIDGPMPVGTCGTEKIVCSHPAVDSTINTLEQPVLLSRAIGSL